VLLFTRKQQRGPLALSLSQLVKSGSQGAFVFQDSLVRSWSA
jgi:hypothetical protein